MNILIAEDDENSRLLLEAILISLGHTVLCAADGKHAWQLAQEGQPDLVITDILMPGMDGFELCRRIRRTDALKQVPIIVYSATYVDRRDEQMALAAGANRFPDLRRLRSASLLCSRFARNSGGDRRSAGLRRDRPDKRG